RLLEEFAALINGDLVGGTMQDKQRQRDAGKLIVKPFVSSHKCRDGDYGLHLVGRQRIIVQGFDDVGIAREVFVLELQGRQVWCDMAEPRDRRQRKTGRWRLEGEVFADEPG